MAAAAAGVRRLVSISTIKVNGEQTAGNKPFTELDRPQPEDAYAQSKWEAEQMEAPHRLTASGQLEDPP